MEDFLKDFAKHIKLEKNHSYNTVLAYVSDVRAFILYLKIISAAIYKSYPKIADRNYLPLSLPLFKGFF